MIKVFKSGEQASIRDGFGEGFMKVGNEHREIVGMSADLTESVRMQKFSEKFPQRFFNTGIQEQNMAATAAGLALEGYIPYIGSFANFQPGRNLDQIRTSICMMNANVKIISSHSAFSYGEDGISVQMLEDIAIMRSLPNMHVWVPGDANQAAEMAIQAAKINGPVYIRLGRAKKQVFASEEFVVGKAQLLRQGKDITIIGISYMLDKALEAAKLLAKEGIDVRVLNMHCIKPLDRDAIIKAASETKGIVTVEDHQVAGGLGSAVAEVLAQSETRVPLRIIGVNDEFGESGTHEELMESRGLTTENIIKAVKEILR